MPPSDEPVTEVGRAAVAEHLRELAFALDHAQARGDEKSVHRARVATRRLRSALDVLEAVIGRSARKPRRQLRTLARVLGRVRDLDVLIEAQKVARIDDRAARRARAPLAADLGRTVDSRRTRRLLARLGRIARAPGGSARRGEPTLHVRDFAGSWLLRRCEAVQAYGPDLVTAPGSTLHRLRIQVKRFRYAMELFGDALEAGGRESVLGVLVRAQDHLGALHDAEVMLDRHPSDPCERVLAALRANTQQVLEELMSPLLRASLILLVRAL